MKPALTAEEWKREWSMDEENMGTPLARAIGTAVVSPEYANRPHSKALHALAALALFGQPFGFTREEAQQLRDILVRLTAREGQLLEERSTLLAIAEKIEALVPE